MSFSSPFHSNCCGAGKDTLGTCTDTFSVMIVAMLNREKLYRRTCVPLLYMAISPHLDGDELLVLGRGVGVAPLPREDVAHVVQLAPLLLVVYLDPVVQALFF